MEFIKYHIYPITTIDLSTVKGSNNLLDAGSAGPVVVLKLGEGLRPAVDVFRRIKKKQLPNQPMMTYELECPVIKRFNTFFIPSLY